MAVFNGTADDATGLSQDTAGMNLSEAARTSAPFGLTAPQAWLEKAFSEFVEQEILKHLLWVAAAVVGRDTTQTMSVPKSVLDPIWLRLGYDPAATDPWKTLGMALSEGLLMELASTPDFRLPS